MNTIPWLLNEDAALKAKLQGLVVFDGNSGPNGRRVPVRYRLPEVEPANLTFPIIGIEHQGWYYAPERSHEGIIQMPYAAEGFAAWWDDSGGPAIATFDPNDSPYIADFPVPYNFDYSVVVYCRFMHEHTIPIIATLATQPYLHPNYGFLDIPQDGTKRTLQLLGGPDLEDDYDANGKRFFRVTYMVRVFSELVPAIVQPILAKSINLDLSVYANSTDLTGPALTEAKGLLSVGANSTWNVQQFQY